MAQQLYRAYTSSRAQYRAIHDVEGQNDWSKVIPLGTAWSGLTAEGSSADIGISTVTGRKGKCSGRGKKSTPPKSAAGIPDTSKEPFKGDRVLAKSISFMRDALISRECAYALADGNTGCVYECLKVSDSTVASAALIRPCVGYAIHICGLNAHKICNLFARIHHEF
jgi:hypothetical protein